MNFRAAVKALLEALILSERIKPSQDAKRRAFNKYKLRGGIERFATAVFYSILRKLGIIDEKIQELTGVKNVYLLDETLRNALRLSIELLRFREISNKQKKQLRSILAGEIRSRSHPYASHFFWEVFPTLEKLDFTPKSEEDRLVYTYYISRFYVRKLMELLPPEEVEAFLKKINEVPPISLRVNTLKASVDEIEEAIRRLGLEVKRSPRVETVLKVYGSLDLERFRPFKEGKVFVQEEAGAVASLVLNPKPGEVVVDLAAAPGGKTVHMGELMKNRGKIYAVDINEKRLERLKELVRRAGLSIVEPIAIDGREAPKVLGEGIADRVMLDAPCTSSGTVQRNPDLRWRIMDEKDILEFVDVQRGLMEAGWKLLKPGGRMLYATCSIFKEEDEDNVAWFLEKHPDARLIHLSGPYDPGFLEGTMRAWPHRHDTIGFFYALLEKPKKS
ncbi:MAG: class I SAM-dependent methyltransferase [Candidatus Diapherotrites archaeon]|nr:class I SAM-dependent methyltransferase [Candidatus Diapherotrites archaeon]